MKVFFKITSIFGLLFFLVAGCQRTLVWDVSERGTLKDAQGICYPYTVYGTFYKGITPGNDTSYIEVKVNIFSPGNYYIYTDRQNGLRFTDSGSFSNTGVHLVKLKPTGTPLAATPANFIVTFGASVCSLTVNVKDTAGIKDTLNTWSYTNTKDKQKYSGTINAIYFLPTPISALLSLRYEPINPSDTTFEISIAFDNAIVPGSYKTDSLNNFSLSTGGICINCAWNVAYKIFGVMTTIVVTDYDPQTKIIKGTFSGTTIDGFNNIAPVKDGAFSAVVK